MSQFTLYTNKDKLQDIINFNNKWWNQQIINIAEKIISSDDPFL